MPAVSLATWQAVWFWGLLGLWAVLLFGGFVLGNPVAAERRRMPTWTRMASSLTLVLAAWSAYAADVLCWGSAAPELVLGVALGMTFGALGDLLLARVLRTPQPTLSGMGAFGLGHLAYSGGMLLWARGQGLDVSRGSWVAWLVWLALGVVGWCGCVQRGRRCTTLHWAALIYAILLANTVGVANALALQRTFLAPLSVGAALFLASDLILAAHLFGGLRHRGLDDLIWLSYGPGQMLIVYTAILPRLLHIPS